MGLFFKNKVIEPKNIIISRTDKIGDLVLSIPSFLMVRKMYPSAKITVLVREYNAPIIENFSFIDNVISIDKYNNNELFSLIKSLQADTFIALYSDSLITWLSLVSGAKFRIGPLSKITSWFIYNYGIKQKRSKSIKNEAEYNLDLVKILNNDLFNKQSIETVKIIYNQINLDNVLEFLKKENIDKYIVIHPFSGGSAKNLTLDEYIDLINTINSKNINEKIVISSSEFDMEDAEYIYNNTENTVIYQSPSILDLAALIDKSEVYFGNSTGPTHIAGNLGKNVVCVYPIKPSLSKTRWGLFLNDKNTTYINPDIESEDYSMKVFNKITNEDINEMASSIVEKIK